MTNRTNQRWHFTNIRVLIADHHPAYLSGLRWLTQALFDLVGEAHDGADALSKALILQPDVVVLDDCMPRLDGIMVVRRIRDELPNTGIVVNSDSDDEGLVLSAGSAGANSYLLKKANWRSLAKAIHYAADGKSYLMPEVAQRMLTALEASRRARAQDNLEWIPLTSQEMAALRMTAEGSSHTAIAVELGVGQADLTPIVSQIFCSLFVADRHEALVQAIKRGFIEV